jgi:hypothetical protein
MTAKGMGCLNVSLNSQHFADIFVFRTILNVKSYYFPKYH